MMTDPIADMLTRIRNANTIERPLVDMPCTQMKARIAQVLKDEGFIQGFEVGKIDNEDFSKTDDLTQPKLTLRVALKYGQQGEKVIRHIQRASKPGLRLYQNHKQLRPVLDGLGITILSTSRGVMSDRQARAQRVGGEVLCTVW